MRVLLAVLWAGCLWSITRSILCMIWAASAGRRVLMLALLALAASTSHRPREHGDTPLP